MASSKDSVSLIKIRAWAMANAGMTYKDIGLALNRQDVTIGLYVREVNMSLWTDPSSVRANYDIKKMIGKAMLNIKDYLNGDIGGDAERYKVTMRIAENAGVLAKMSESDAPGATTVNFINSITADITVNPQPDSEFTDGLPKQLRRIVGAAERLIPGQVDEGTEQP